MDTRNRREQKEARPKTDIQSKVNQVCPHTSGHRSFLPNSLRLTALAFLVVILVIQWQHQTPQNVKRHMLESTRRNEQDLHSSHLDILGLLDWEEDSLTGIVNYEGPVAGVKQVAQDTCHPPVGVSKQCCLGSFSTGEVVNPGVRGQCAASMTHLDAVKASTQAFFNSNALPSGEGIVRCDVCRIVDLARHSNLTISFIGGSMHGQIIEGLSCELERRNYIVTREQLHVEPGHLDHMCTQFKIRSPLWPTEQVVTIQYHMVDMIPLYDRGHDILALSGWADVVVFGYGLQNWFYNQGQWTPQAKREPVYAEGMRDVFTQIKEQEHVKLMVHRETSAQHFDTDGGEYALWQYRGAKRTKTCQPFRNTGKSVDWQDRAIQRAGDKSGHKMVVAGPNMPPSDEEPEVVVLPYFDYTSQHHYMHPHHNPQDENDFDDCTHFCGSPFLYYPIWRSLRFAFDRSFALQENAQE